MKTLSMKKLSLAVLTAACVLGLGVVEAAPKVSVKISTPVGTAGADKAVAGKGLAWLPCGTAATALSGLTTAGFSDKLQFDIDVTNADDDKDSGKLMDYELYVFFIDYTTVAGITNALGGNNMYALTPNATLGGPGLTPLVSSSVTLAAIPSSYRFMSKADFGVTAAFKSTLFGGPIALDTNTLPQGLWSILAIMTRPIAAADTGGTLPSPALVGAHVDPGFAAGSLALQDPRNWAAWAMQPFVLGTPFRTATGLGTGVAAGAGTCL